MYLCLMLDIVLGGAKKKWYDGLELYQKVLYSVGSSKSVG